MTTLITQPQLLATAAADASAIGSAMNEAKAAAAGPTTGLVAAAQDEVSTITAQLFGAYGREYQALLQQAAAFHNEFVATLGAAGNAYAQAEAQAAGTLGLTSGASSSTAVTAASNATDPAVSQIIFLGATGHPNPPPSTINSAYTLYMNNPNNMYTPGPGALTPFMFALPSAQGAYIFTGTKDLTYNISLARGVTSLDTQIAQSFAAGATSLGIGGYSQGAQVASLAMPGLAKTYSPSQLSFTLIADPLAPNGGFFSRFPGLNLPSIGVTFGGGTPSDLFPTTIYTREYDGLADFPQYPIDVLSDLNAVAGIVYVHPLYPHLDPSTVTLVQLPTSPGYTGHTTYYMGLTPNLPLLEPLRQVPVVGNPMADLLQPDLTYLVNWGYGNPLYGYSTGPANVPTPFGLFPPLSATTALGPLMISGTQQGIVAAAGDFMTEGTSALSHPLLSPTGIWQSLSSISLSSPGTLLSRASIDGLLESLASASTNIPNAISQAGADVYAVLLPTADILNAAVTVIPAYDATLFVNGITQAAGGDPMGLINAVGYPLAATTGLLTLAGGIEGLVVIGGALKATKAFTGLVS